MRKNLFLYINGQAHQPQAADAFLPLTDYLRYQRSLSGTKVVCAEGDCGACTVLVGRPSRQGAASSMEYVPVNGCIQYLYQLDATHVITVEGLNFQSQDESGSAGQERLNPVQCSMVQNNGAQCGYCTPGFVMALSASAYCPSLAYRDGDVSSCQSVKDALTGNLCRCTGYEAIIKAGVEAQYKDFTPLTSLYPQDEICARLVELAKDDVEIAQHHGDLEPSSGVASLGGRKIFIPTTVEGCSRALESDDGAVLVAGGTDVSVNCNKRGLVPPVMISTARLGLDTIEETIENGRVILVIGANVSLARLERKLYETLPQLHSVLFTFGSPQIRMAGTLAGNLANGSPVSDSAPYLICMDGAVEVTSQKGSRRISMRDFYLGYKKLALARGEVITRVYLPLPRQDELVRLYKVTRREHLDISSFTAAISTTCGDGVITSASVVFGGVAATVIPIPAAQDYLVGKPFSLETFASAGLIAADAIEPITDVRGSREYRATLARNILIKYFYEATQADSACQNTVGVGK